MRMAENVSWFLVSWCQGGDCIGQVGDGDESSSLFSLLWTSPPCCHLVTKGMISELRVTNWKRMRFFLRGGGTVIEMRDRDVFRDKNKEKQSRILYSMEPAPQNTGKDSIVCLNIALIL